MRKIFTYEISLPAVPISIKLKVPQKGIYCCRKIRSKKYIGDGCIMKQRWPIKTRLTGKEGTSPIQVSSRNQMKEHPQLLFSKRGKEEGYIGI